MSFRRLLLLMVLVSIDAIAANPLITNITKTDDSWAVEYVSHAPIRSIELSITPDRSRKQRWHFEDDKFTFIQSGGNDVIIRKDNALFSSVKITLTPSYIALPKYYAPFSPYSDGGVLFHSARFFACAQLCQRHQNQWYFTLKVPEGEHVYLRGVKHTNSVTWWDKNDGSKIYVGTQQLDHHNGFISVIDTGLPESIEQALTSFFPKMALALERRYMKLKEKPMLFASFGQTQGKQYGRQGGVLPSQVFMHWYGKLPTMSEQEVFEIIWFFAHETAHLYQGQIKGGIESQLSWIHEGHAQFVAMHLVIEMAGQYEEQALTKLAEAKKGCSDALEENILSAHSENYQLLYQCGLVVFDLLHIEMGSIESVDKFWLSFESASKKPGFEPKQAFLELAQSKLTLQGYEKLINTVN